MAMLHWVVLPTVEEFPNAYFISVQYHRGRIRLPLQKKNMCLLDPFKLVVCTYSVSSTVELCTFDSRHGSLSAILCIRTAYDKALSTMPFGGLV